MDQSLLERLRDPACYPDAAGPIGIVQTHLSVVCLAGDRVYKLKKPVRLPFVDYSTRERRLHFCLEEVRLNRRLCPDVYLGVAALRGARRGEARFDAPAGDPRTDRSERDVLDWAVVMKRLPEERMLNRMIESGAASVAHLDGIARTMARFHAAMAAAADDAVRAAGDPDAVARFAAENFTETLAQSGTVFDAVLHDRLAAMTAAAFARLLPVLEARRSRGRVAEGHGDLHCRNICLTEPAAIYDCIEFSAGFRCGDVALENAFLVMDLTYRGRPDLAAAYLAAYARESGDAEQPALMPVLVSYRAMVRAKVAAIAADEPELGDDQRADSTASARRHMNLAAASLLGEPGGRPIALISCGLPGTGKSRVFAEFVRHCGWHGFASDPIRKELAGVPPHDPAPAEAYSRSMSDAVYSTLARRACAAVVASDVRQLARPAVLLDANFPTRRRRAEAVRALRMAGAEPVVIWFDPPEHVVEKRLDRRKSEGHSVSDADRDVYRKLKPAFEPPIPGEEEATVIRLASDRQPECQAAEILAAMAAEVA